MLPHGLRLSFIYEMYLLVGGFRSVGYLAKEICIPDCCACVYVCGTVSLCYNLHPVWCKDQPPAGLMGIGLVIDPAYPGVSLKYVRQPVVP